MSSWPHISENVGSPLKSPRREFDTGANYRTWILQKPKYSGGLHEQWDKKNRTRGWKEKHRMNKNEEEEGDGGEKRAVSCKRSLKAEGGGRG